MEEKRNKGTTLPEFEERKTDIHLIMVLVVTVFNILLMTIICIMSWEMWMLPLIAIALIAAWVLHIVKIFPAETFESFCIGIMVIEFFFYGAHESSLYDMAVVIGVLLFVISMLDKKYVMHLVAATYVLTLMYHCVFLHTISINMPLLEMARLALDIIGVSIEMMIARHMANRRKSETVYMRNMSVKLNEAKDRNANFLANISHELRTPINMVTGISEVALGRKLSPQLKSEMNSIQMAGLRLSGQIKDILDYTEIVGKTLVPVEDHYMITSVIGDVIAMTSVQNRNLDIELVFDMDVSIPAVLVGDGEKLCRVIKLMLDNAIKFTREGGVCVRIGYREESYGINLDIDICDTGMGIKPSELSQIYDEFYQIDSGRSRGAGGLGLGIPIAHGLLQAMGGFMYIESKEELGTQIHISVPQKVVDNSPSMTVNDPEKLCIACYFKADKYERKEVREYYDVMIYRMAMRLGVEGHRIYHIEELEKLNNSHRITHLFIAREEYEERASYFEDLGKTMCLVVIADDRFKLPADSSLIFFRKPFNPIPIVNLLNGETHGKDSMGGMIVDQPFTCEGVKALVVDDEEMNLVVARGILGNYGMNVDTASGGEEAVEKCVNTEYDIVFLDHMMPKFDGVETLKRIRVLKGGAYQNTPVIALTANAVSGAREMFKNEGFTEFVPKPIERMVLERALRRVLPEQSIHYIECDETEAAAPYAASDAKKGIEPDAEVVIASDTGVDEKTDIESDMESGAESDTPVNKLKKAGINVEIGLQYCSESEEFYMEMLKMFYEQSKDKKEEIYALYNEGNWEEYAVKVHALKSTSLMIGAEQLSDKAKVMEQAGKNGDDSYIRKNHSDLMESYDAFCELIASSLGMEDGQEGGEKL
ncbi:MAG: response regulator [Lachnospiraceae bacterium]|nr:response regulator [Lachnospiraceae bacterium]